MHTDLKRLELRIRRRLDLRLTGTQMHADLHDIKTMTKSV